MCKNTVKPAKALPSFQWIFVGYFNFFGLRKLVSFSLGHPTLEETSRKINPSLLTSMIPSTESPTRLWNLVTLIKWRLKFKMFIFFFSILFAALARKTSSTTSHTVSLLYFTDRRSPVQSKSWMYSLFSIFLYRNFLSKLDCGEVLRVFHKALLRAPRCV